MGCRGRNVDTFLSPRFIIQAPGRSIATIFSTQHTKRKTSCYETFFVFIVVTTGLRRLRYWI
jgi:hypothetical protein